MNIVRIIKKEFKIILRNKKANLMMVLFPIVLIIILGAAFSNVYNTIVDVGDIHVVYLDESKGSGVSDAFEQFREEIHASMGVTFEESISIETGADSVREKRSAAFIHIRDLNITLYKNERQDIRGTLLETALSSFTKTYSAISIAVANNPAVMSELSLDNIEGNVASRSLDRNRQPGSTDYYAVTMLTMILMYASQTGYWGIRGEYTEKTAYRTLCAPIRSYEYLTGKIAGSILVTLVQGLVVILFSNFVLKAYWGENFLIIGVLLLTYSIMAISMGVSLAYIFKKEHGGITIINTVIPILVFLGGGYVPLNILGGSIEKIAVISPVRWMNSALFDVIYSDSISNASISVAINLIVSALLIAIAVLFSKRGNKAYA